MHSGFDTNWVLVKRLKKSTHFLSIEETNKMEKMAMTYLKEIVKAAWAIDFYCLC